MKLRQIGCVLLAIVVSGPVLATVARGEDEPKPATKPAEAPAQRRGNGALAGLMLQRVSKVLSELNLSADQKTKTDAVMKKTQEEFKTLREEANVEPGERVKRLQEVMGNMRTQLQGILNEDQLRELRQKMQPASAGGGEQRNPIERLKEAMGKLDLSEDQKKQVEGAVKKTQGDMEKIRQESGGSPDAMREKMQTVREETMRRLNDILTPEQSEKLRSLLTAGAGTTRPA